MPGCGERQLWLLKQKQPLSLLIPYRDVTFPRRSLSPCHCPEEQGASRPILVVAEGTEEYYVLKEEVLSRLEELRECKEQLLSSEPVRARLHRQLTVFRPSPAAARFELPHDFFNLTLDELRREQRLR